MWEILGTCGDTDVNIPKGIYEPRKKGDPIMEKGKAAFIYTLRPQFYHVFSKQLDCF